MKICVLGSGSSGNCTYIETRRTRVLVDAGFGPRSMARRLREAGLDDGPFDALLVTHGHRDHCGSAAALAERWGVPVYCNAGTRQEVPDLESLDRVEVFRSNRRFSIGDLTVEPFAVLHDSAEPVGFRISGEGMTGAVATDLGEITPSVVRKLLRCDWIVLESNHDEELLRLGDYPWILKQRLTSSRGHLSNRAFAHFLSDFFDGHAAHVFLAHLSQNNNDPDIAMRTARSGLEARPRRSFHDLWNACRLHLTYQAKPSIVIGL